MMSNMTLVVYTAVGLETGKANACLKNTTIALMKFSLSPLGRNSGNWSIFKLSSGRRLHSVMWKYLKSDSCVIYALIFVTYFTLTNPVFDVCCN